MCDYSLEAYRSRPARKGEQYTLHRFASGSVGFVSAGDCTTAVCVAPDTRLRLSELPEPVRQLHGLQAVEEVSFLRQDGGYYRDGVRFSSGLELSLQRLPVGITATISAALEQQAPKLAEPAPRELELVE